MRSNTEFEVVATNYLFSPGLNVVLGACALTRHGQGIAMITINIHVSNLSPSSLLMRYPSRKQLPRPPRRTRRVDQVIGLTILFRERGFNHCSRPKGMLAPLVNSFNLIVVPLQDSRLIDNLLNSPGRGNIACYSGKYRND